MQEGGGSHRPLVLAAFAIGAAILSYRTYAAWDTTPLLLDTDDAMRMVVVRDLLAGQDWYDHVQHRLNTPQGAEIHWSRLVDLPIALLTLLLRPIAGAASDMVAAMAWPLLLLFVLLWLSARCALRLVGPQGVLPAVVLPLLSPAVTNEFTPGRIDHHNIQVILTFALAWASLESLKRPRFALAAGLLAATALAIGIEALPAIVAAILAFGLMWVFLPQTGRQLRWFGLAFAGGSLVHLAIALPPARWFTPACDALSVTYVVAAVLVGLAFAALSLLRAPAAWPGRLGLGIAAGAAVIALTLAAFPTCLTGPYAAVDPWLRHNWIEAIAEAKPWFASLRDLPAYTLAVGIPPVLGLAVIAYRVRVKAGDRAAWLVLACFLTVATLVMLAQVRGARLATMPAIPAAAWLIVHARSHYLARRSPVTVFGLVASWFAFAGVLVVLVVSHVVTLVPGRAQEVAAVRGDREACQLPSSFAEIAAMAPTRVMTPVDLGAHMLLETHHAVVAAPYHRNEAGVRDAFAFFNQPIAEARAIAAERGLGLVVTCPAMAEMRGMAWAAEDSFVRLLERDALPDWLHKVPVAGPLEVYRVTLEAR